ncbi:MAG: hypothetical protein EXS35_00185 [Pedosphaera sp.]|nr:hypothetical protein [Pedosphaera sp.]
MDWSNIDWAALERLRATFLAGTAGGNDYWQNEAELASYDATFAQRIGWKWDYVLGELQRRGWSPPCGELFDWGCGSGIAGRAFLDAFGAESVSSLRLWDRSALAMQFAAKRAVEKYPGLKIETGHIPTPAAETGARTKASPRPTASPSPGGEGRGEGGRGFILLISHVVTELTPPQTEELLMLAATATAVLWVEPGTYESSYTLIAIREKLREQFNVVAPCTHQARCGMLAAENKRHWCHHFAAPPPGIFTDGDWSRFANFTGVDLRDLPLSFLVLDKRPVPPLPPGAARVIGHPRVYKPHALLLGCDESGVRERKLTKRALPEEFKRLRKGDCAPVQVWQSDGDKITDVSPM